MDVNEVPLSGRIYTDSLIKGPKWAGLALTFSFPTSAAQFTGYTDGEPFNNFEGLNAAQQAAVRAMLASISTFTNLVFTELSGSEASGAVLRFGMTDDMGPNAVAHAYLPHPSEYGGDSWYRNSEGWNDNPVLGNDAWNTFIHEIGHTLGLGHPHEAEGSEPAMPSDRDFMVYTVMSYEGYPNSLDGWAQTYMMEDIAALQFLYGANFSHNNTNTVYQWNPSTGEMSINGVGQGAPSSNHVLMTVWDGGGIDTYDLSNYSRGVTIDLRPGAWSRLSGEQTPILPGSVPGNVSNALLYNGDLRSLIENAIGSAGIDTIYGNQLANELSGGDGSDWIEGFAGTDTLIGGGGWDMLYGGDDNDSLFGGDGNDTLYGDGGDDWLDGGVGDDYLQGYSGNDTLIGGAGADQLIGGPGADLFVYLAASDSVLGQRDWLNDFEHGVDLVDLRQVPILNLAFVLDNSATIVTADVASGLSMMFLIAGVATAADFLVTFASAPGQTLVGTSGDDTLTGGSGNDTIDGRAGNDTMAGGAGDDIYFVDNAGDQVIENASAGYDMVFATISYTLGANVERVVAYDPAATTALNFTGNASANEITGNAGANIIDGGAGADFMTGHGGNDIYFVDNAGDYVLETAGGGYDTVFASISYTLGANVERVFAYDPASTAALNFTGNALDNELGGTAGANILDGGAGADLMVGGDGNDVYFVDNPGDVVSESPTGGYDTVFSSISFTLNTRIERVVALDPNATTALNFTGNASANEITGNAGSNVIDGGGGADILFGGGGADAFMFSTALDGGNIAALPDFVPGTDRIYLDDAVFAGLTPGALAAGAFHTGSAAADAHDRIIYDPITGALYYDADGNGTGLAIQFATLHEGLAISASDFQVI